MSNLFEGSDTEFEFKTDSEYAKKYDKWRKREELNKLKTKYGEDDSEESSSESDDQEIEFTEKEEKDFFKILACLKSKDPRIYDNSVKFFDDEDDDNLKTKIKKDRPLYIKDYERNLILEKQGVLSDEESNTDLPKPSNSKIEQNNLITSLDNLDDNEAFVKREKLKSNTPEVGEQTKQWLAGQKKQLEDKKTEIELKPLKEFWSQSDLDKDEKFIRDYFLQQQFLEKDDDDCIPTYDEIIHDSDENFSNDEENIEKQEEFEHKYNFRFEEPDEDFIKRYPRTIQNSLRQRDDKRKVKRQEIKERKKKEKEEKMQDLKKLQELKRKEIEEKLEKLNEITGNSNCGFDDKDLEGDFDPDQYDQRMQELFNEEFYDGAEGDQKPEFPDIDEELEIENYRRFEQEEHAPHCEDEEFNMDADYDPNNITKKELTENIKGKKKRKRKSKFMEAVTQSKPKFDPNDKTYEEYFDEYYKLDCEDIIGDIPCRFKYRKVIPNDFGLTTEEILMARDRELNKWCSLKKTVQIRPEHVEKYEQIAYRKKAENISLKKKMLPSIFNTDNDEVTVESSSSYNTEETEIQKNKELNDANINEKFKLNETNNDNEKVKTSTSTKVARKIKLEKHKIVDNVSSKKGNTSSGKSNIKNNIKIKNKKKAKINKVKVTDKDNIINDKDNIIDNKTIGHTRKNNSKKRKCEDHNNLEGKKKFKKNEVEKNPILAISDQRLVAYGIKPKKFRNKLKYKT